MADWDVEGAKDEALRPVGKDDFEANMAMLLSPVGDVHSSICTQYASPEELVSAVSSYRFSESIAACRLLGISSGSRLSKGS